MEQAVSPRDALRQLIEGYKLSQCVFVACELGIADLLKEGTQTSEELAKASGAHPGALFRLMRALTSAGVFTRQADGRFALNEVGEFLCRDNPRSIRGWAILNERQIYPTWNDLLYSVKTGEPAFDHVHGMSAWQYRKQNSEAGQVFDEAMTALTAGSAQAVVETYDFSRFDCLVDVGGGNGLLVATILRANPGLRAVLFDQAQVVEGTRPMLEAAGVAERCEVVGGSFFEAVPGGGDVYILKSIIHDWNDQDAVHILKNCGRAMQPQTTLLLVERVLPADKPPVEAVQSDMTMLVMIGGRERTLDEFRDVLKAGGFELTSVIATRTPYQIIEARSL